MACRFMQISPGPSMRCEICSRVRCCSRVDTPHIYIYIRIAGLLLNLTPPICGKIYSHEALASKLAIPANMLLGVAPCCHSYHDERVKLVYPHLLLRKPLLILQF